MFLYRFLTRGPEAGFAVAGKCVGLQRNACTGLRVDSNRHVAAIGTETRREAFSRMVIALKMFRN
jgi:hypothetical protein